MSTIFVVLASGGQYEDYWEQNICAFDTYWIAKRIIESLEGWLVEIREMELPALAPDGDDFIDDDYVHVLEHHAKIVQQFKEETLIEKGIPTELHSFLLHNWESSYDCDYPSFSIDEIPFASEFQF